VAVEGRRKWILARVAADGNAAAPLPERLCATCVQLAGVTGAGLTMIAGEGQRALVHATDTVAAVLEEAQMTVGEGPCVDAFSGRGPVLVPDLCADAGRWPAFSPHATAAGVAAVFSFPLQVGAARLGVLDLYRSATGPLSDQELADTLICADLATDALLTSESGYVELASLDGVDTHPQVYQAAGMVMVQLSVGAEEALLRLRGYAYAHDLLVTEVARDIVGRRLRLEGDHHD
jgi:hypothetical protein